MDSYIDAKAMVTPGVAGATVTLITANLVDMFPLKGNWAALGLSFLIGVLVWQDKGVPIIQRGVLYILNSLIIFSVASGINTAGYDVVRSQMNAPTSERPRDQPRGIPGEGAAGEQAGASKYFRSWDW